MRVFIKNRILFYFIFFIYTPASFAQDYSFSQFWENRIYYNPSFVGLNEGEFNGQLTYRKLWPKFPGNFSTIFFSADLKTYNNYGFGLSVISSDEGGGFIKSNSIAVRGGGEGNIFISRN